MRWVFLLNKEMNKQRGNKMKNLITLIFLSILVCGCASTVTKGMTKDQVKEFWGSPDSIRTTRNSCCNSRGEESWLYFGRGLRLSQPEKSVVFQNGQAKYIFKRL
jgi:hypothetical protein